MRKAHFRWLDFLSPLKAPSVLPFPWLNAPLVTGISNPMASLRRSSVQPRALNSAIQESFSAVPERMRVTSRVLVSLPVKYEPRLQIGMIEQPGSAIAEPALDSVSNVDTVFSGSDRSKTLHNIQQLQKRGQGGAPFQSSTWLTWRCVPFFSVSTCCCLFPIVRESGHGGAPSLNYFFRIVS